MEALLRFFYCFTEIFFYCFTCFLLCFIVLSAFVGDDIRQLSTVLTSSGGIFGNPLAGFLFFFPPVGGKREEVKE